VVAADAGKEVDRLAAQARDGTHKVDQKLEEYRQKAEKNIDQTIQKTGTELNKAVDAFDKNVGEVSYIQCQETCVTRCADIMTGRGEGEERNLKLVRWQQVKHVPLASRRL